MQVPQKTVAKLREQLESLSQAEKKRTRKTFFSELPELNRLLPGGGFRSGDLWEWIAADALAAPAMVSLLAAREWITRDRPAILLERTFSERTAKIFPPALAAAGFDLQTLVEVQPANDRDLLWAWEQSLGCPAVSLVWGELPRIAPLAYRRLKLAAEQSGAIGFLIRPQAALKRPTWADGRLLVSPLASVDESPRFAIELDPETGSGRKAEVEFGTAAKLRQRIFIAERHEPSGRIANHQ